MNDNSYDNNQQCRFDLDSSIIGIDNRCTACISHRRNDFIGYLTSTNKTITGYGGTTHKGLMKGTIK